MFWKTELITGTRLICWVKCVIPSRLLSCCKDTIIAAPAMNPIKIALDKKSMINPSLQSLINNTLFYLYAFFRTYGKKIILTKSRSNDYLRIPSEAWNRPAKKVEVRASWRNRTGSAEGDTSCLSIDPKTSEAIETGPTARSLELPRTA